MAPFHVVRCIGAVCAAVLTALTAAGPTAADTPGETLLRPGVAVGELRLGMTLKQVRKALGAPLLVSYREQFPAQGTYVQYNFGRDTVVEVGVFTKRGATVARVVLVKSSKGARTSAGIGVGSTHKTLQRRLGARCYRQLVGDKIYAPYRDFVSCYLGKTQKTPVTHFSLVPECSLPPDRYSRICSTDKRIYRADSVTIVSLLGQSVLGGPCRFERAYRDRCG
jgi:hypothetical protein